MHDIGRKVHVSSYIPIYISARFVLHVRMHVFCALAVSVSEVLPREKKAKEEKTVTIGMASVDIIPLLLGEAVCTFMHA